MTSETKGNSSVGRSLFDCGLGLVELTSVRKNGSINPNTAWLQETRARSGIREQSPDRGLGVIGQIRLGHFQARWMSSKSRRQNR